MKAYLFVQCCDALYLHICAHWQTSDAHTCSGLKHVNYLYLQSIKSTLTGNGAEKNFAYPSFIGPKLSMVVK